MAAQAALAAGIDVDLRPFCIASIAINDDTINIRAIRDRREPPPRPPSSTIARDLQNELVGKLLTLDLATREIQTVLSDKSATVHVPPAQPAPAPGGAESPHTLSAGDLLINTPK
jgi:hypothetical protein